MTSLIAALNAEGDGWSSPVLTTANSVAIRLAAFNKICPEPQATSQTVMDNKAASLSSSLSLSCMI